MGARIELWRGENRRRRRHEKGLEATGRLTERGRFEGRKNLFVGNGPTNLCGYLHRQRYQINEV